MSNNTELKFTKTHEWLKHEGEENIIGITDHAQHLLGDLVFVELPTIGQAFHQGDECGVVESVKAASDIYAPVSGTVTAINEQLKNEPQLINQDPFGAGWLIKIQASEPTEINALLSYDQYQLEIAGDQ